jgi:PAS domain S-box-containing protein
MSEVRDVSFGRPVGRAPDPDAQLLHRLRSAVRHDELALHYQPVVQFPDGAVVGFEALCRWQDAELGAVPPDRFITLAERDDLICDLGRWVLSTACAEAAGWQREHLGISVNVAARQLTDPRFVPDVVTALETSSFAPGRLTLEITETAALASMEAASAVLRTVHELGVRIALDDFGTGYSSLTMLQQLPVDVVKIDRSFVTRISTDARDAVLVRLVIDAAHTAGSQVCAEGVEELEQAEQLMAMGCDLGQGWLFGRPTPRARGAEHDLGAYLSAPDIRSAAARMPWAGSTELVLVSSEGRIKFASMSSQRMLGWTAQELVGADIDALLRPMPLDEDETPSPGGSPGPVVRRVLHRDGEYRWLETTSRHLHDPAGGDEVLTVSRDVTATVQARAAADDVQALFRHAFDEAPTGMAITDLDGSFLRVNRAFAGLLGMCPEDLQDRTVESITHPDDRLVDEQNVAELRRAEAESHDLYKRYLHRDGSAVPCRVRAVLARDHVRPDGYIVAHVTPVTLPR